MQAKNYYKVLGVSEQASKQELKIIYRKLAKKYHPDANSGDTEAEQRFKDITEAYDVLKDDEKRRKYDQLKKLNFGAEGGQWFSYDANGAGRQPDAYPFAGAPSGQGTNFSFADILKEIFGLEDLAKHTADNAKDTAHGKVLSAEIEISLDEAAVGGSKLLKLSIPVLCEQCKGAGYIRTGRCASCQGRGKTKTTRKIRVKIPPGIDDSHKLRLKNVIPAIDNRPSLTDVDVIIKIKPHEFFEKRGLDIYCEIPVENEILQYGARIRVHTISKNKVAVSIPAGTAKGTIFRIPRLGIRKNGHIGDQLVKFI